MKDVLKRSVTAAVAASEELWSIADRAENVRELWSRDHPIPLLVSTFYRNWESCDLASGEFDCFVFSGLF